MSYGNQQWPQQPSSQWPQSGGQQWQQGGGYYPPPPKSGGSSWTWILLLGGGGLAIVILAICGGMIAYFASPPRASAAAKQPFPYGDTPLPAFPQERGEPEIIEGNVQRYEMMIGDIDGGYYEQPGHGGYFYLSLPPGEHVPKSLPCILITGAGSDLLSGMEVGDGDFPEHVPYAQAGFAVLAYELDGPNYSDTGDPEEMSAAYGAFKDSRAGLVNAYNALEFVLNKVPEVDPGQIYAAGHSSAATHALLFAEHEPRLAGVIAYAPCIDIPKRFGPGPLRIFSFLMPGVVDFATQSSPNTHRERLKCQTFLFHAEDDSNCPIAETKQFADQLKQQGTDVTLVTVPTGDHYDSMIDQGIPSAIQWLNGRRKK